MYKRIRTKISFIILIVLLNINIVACWDSLDINKRNIILSLYIDYKDDKYIFSGEMASINTPGSSPDQPPGNAVTTFYSEGDSLIEVRDDLERETENRIFVAANRVVIFGEGIAKKGIEEYLCRLLADVGYRQRLNPVTSATPPEKLYKAKIKNSICVGFDIQSVIETLQARGINFNTNLGQTTEHLASKNNSFLLPQFDSRNDNIELTGYSVFKHGKKVGVINSKKSMGEIFILSNSPAPFINVKTSNDNYVVRVQMDNRKIKPYYKDSKLEFDYNMKLSGEIQYSADIKRMITDKDITEIKQNLTEQIKETITMSIDRAQRKFRADFFEFFSYYNIKYPVQAEKIKDWDEMFAEAKVNVNIDIHEMSPPPPLFN